MKFLIDNQLPNALAKWIRDHGHEAVHVVDINFDEASDWMIWRYAVQHSLVLITKDEDFLHIAHKTPDQSTSIIWVRLGNCRKQELFSAFELVWDSLVKRITDGHLVIELLP